MRAALVLLLALCACTKLEQNGKRLEGSISCIEPV